MQHRKLRYRLTIHDGGCNSEVTEAFQWKWYWNCTVIAATIRDHAILVWRWTCNLLLDSKWNKLHLKPFFNVKALLLIDVCDALRLGIAGFVSTTVKMDYTKLPLFRSVGWGEKYCSTHLAHALAPSTLNGTFLNQLFQTYIWGKKKKMFCLKSYRKWPFETWGRTLKLVVNYSPVCVYIYI